MSKNPSRTNFEIFGLEEEYVGMKKSPAFLEYTHWQQLKNRILVINGDVDDYLIDEVLIPILTWNKEDEGIAPQERKPISIYVNSDGGAVDVALGIISAIKASQTPVHTYVLGKAYSAGAIILMAGHKRFAFEFSNVLIHEGSVGIMNSSSKTADFIEFSKRQNEKIKEMILTRTKISAELYDKKYRDEWYLLGFEALELGVVDEII